MILSCVSIRIIIMHIMIMHHNLFMMMMMRNGDVNHYDHHHKEKKNRNYPWLHPTTKIDLFMDLHLQGYKCARHTTKKPPTKYIVSG